MTDNLEIGILHAADIMLPFIFVGLLFVLSYYVGELWKALKERKVLKDENTSSDKSSVEKTEFMDYNDILFIRVGIGGGWVCYNAIEVILKDGTSFIDKSGGTQLMEKVSKTHDCLTALKGLSFQPNGKYDFSSIDSWPSVITENKPRVLRMDSVTTIWFVKDDSNESGFSVIHSSGDTYEEWYELYGEVTSNYEDIIRMINLQGLDKMYGK